MRIEFKFLNFPAVSSNQLFEIRVKMKIKTITNKKVIKNTKRANKLSVTGFL